MIRNLMLAAFFGIAAACAGATETWATVEKDPAKLQAALDAILRDHVKDGVVDYAGLAKPEVRKRLHAYLAEVAVTDVARLGSKERVAFWINAYNAFTLELILSHYPKVESIRDLHRPWDTRKWRAAGWVYSLNDIEHRILRKVLREPRVHFALVCASVSCPDLAPRAYTAQALDRELDAAARRFLENREKGLRTGLEHGRPTVWLSSIFDWYGEDFEKDGREVIDGLLPYLSKEDRTFVASHRKDLEVRFLDYDWSLNGR